MSINLNISWVILFILHAFATFAMTGLIWLIQLVHYPSFKYISQESYSRFHQFHTQTITWIVGPLMLIEIITGAYLIFINKSSPIYGHNILFLSLLIIWVTTALLSVPAHQKLMEGQNFKVIQFLVFTNWIRTLLWSLRSLLIIKILFELLNGKT